MELEQGWVFPNMEHSRLEWVCAGLQLVQLLASLTQLGSSCKLHRSSTDTDTTNYKEYSARSIGLLIMVRVAAYISASLALSTSSV